MRRTIEWALWSKRNTAIAAVVFLFATWVVSAGLSVLTASVAQEQPARVARAAPAHTRAPSPTPTENLGDDHDDAHERVSAATRAAISERAREFTRAWLDTTREVKTTEPPARKGGKPRVRVTTRAVSREDWLRGIAPYIDGGLLPMMQTTNLDAIPRGEAGAVTVTEATATNAQAVAELPGGQSMTIGLTWSGHTWEVNALTPGDPS